VLTLACAAGCTNRIKADRGVFDAGYAAFEAGRWQEAVDKFSLYLQQDPTTASRGEVYYYRGQALVHLSRRQEAKEDFLRAIGAGAQPPVAQFAQVAIGNVYYEEGDDARAVEHYARACDGSQKDLPRDMICLRLGVSLQRLGKWQAAQRYLEHLVEQYPGTPAAAEARRRVNATAFVVQTGAYSSMTVASGQARQVQAKGFSAQVVKTTSAGRTLYAVHTGRLATYREAEALAARIRQAGFPALVVP
jgi:TolA-binding protein